MANDYISQITLPNNSTYDINDTTKLPLAGGNMTGNINRYYSTSSTEPMLKLSANNVNAYLFQIGHGTSAGNVAGNYYILKYVGQQNTPDNELQLILNKLRGVINVVAVKAPGYGDRRKEMLEDIAVLTGGEVITSDIGLELKDTKIEQLGRAKQVKVQKENTIIVDGAGDKEQISARVRQIRMALEETTSEFDAITYAIDWMKRRNINASNLMYCRVEEVFDSELRTNVLLWIGEQKVVNDMSEQFAVKMGNGFIATLYDTSTSEQDEFDRALKTDTIEEARALLTLSMKRNKGTSKTFTIVKRVVTFEDIDSI